MQRASGDTTRTPIRSTPNRHAQDRTANGISTRRLSAAIDGLRREGETVLWELNSLMTQNLTLEQRLKLQTEELDLLCRGLVNLREQHKTMEQEYKQEVRVIKSELEAIQEERSASNPGRTGHDRRHSSSQSGSSSRLGSERDVQHQFPQHPHNRTGRPFTPLQSTSSSLSYRDDRRPSYRGTESHSLHTTRIETPGDSRSPSPTKPPSYSQLSSAPRSPRGGHPTWPSPHHHPSQEDDATPSGSQHEPSLSPTATLNGGDIPSRPRSRRTRQ